MGFFGNNTSGSWEKSHLSPYCTAAMHKRCARQGRSKALKVTCEQGFGECSGSSTNSQRARAPGIFRCCACRSRASGSRARLFDDSRRDAPAREPSSGLGFRASSLGFKELACHHLPCHSHTNVLRKVATTRRLTLQFRRCKESVAASRRALARREPPRCPT